MGKNLKLTCLLLIPYVILPFSPYLSYQLALLSLLIFSFVKRETCNRKYLYVLMCLLAVLCLSLTAMSLGYRLFSNFGHDFTDYYNNYIYIKANGLDRAALKYGGGLEVFLPVLNYLLSKIIGYEAYKVYASHTFIINMLFFILVYRLCSKYCRGRDVFILAFCMVVFFKYAPAYITLRQTYASLFILIALFSEAKATKWFLAFLALISHLSTILVFPILILLLRPGSFRVKFCFCLLASMFSFLVYFVMHKGFTDYIASYSYIFGKLSFYYQEVYSPRFIELNVIPLLRYTLPIWAVALILILAFFASKFKRVDFLEYGQKHAVILLCFCLSVVFIPFSYRLLVPIMFFMIGYFVYFSNVKFVIKRHEADSFALSSFYIVSIVFYFAFFFNWLNNPVNYYNFALLDFHPFHYLEVFDRQVFSVDRSSLSKEVDINGHQYLIF